MSKLDDINKRLRRISIKGKDYIEVNQRILAFRELYPSGRIITRKLADNGSRCDFIAEVYDDDVLMATGHSFEFQSAGMVNKTSYVENAETSAVGRALGMLGIGIVESLASADEVQAAIDHQQAKEEPQSPPESAQNPLERAQAQLVAAEKQYCEANGIGYWGDFHREQVMTRPDYANTVEALTRIAAELIEAS